MSDEDDEFRNELHNRAAGNCVYQSAKATDDEYCEQLMCVEANPPKHDITAKNCVYMVGQLDMSAVCRVCPPLLPQTEHPPVGEVVGSDEPAKKEEEFVAERIRLRAMFSIPQITQTHRLKAEQLSEDFANLAQRITTELPGGPDRDQIVYALSDAHLRMIRALSLD